MLQVLCDVFFQLWYACWHVDVRPTVDGMVYHDHTVEIRHSVLWSYSWDMAQHAEITHHAKGVLQGCRVSNAVILIQCHLGEYRIVTLHIIVMTLSVDALGAGPAVESVKQILIFVDHLLRIRAYWFWIVQWNRLISNCARSMHRRLYSCHFVHMRDKWFSKSYISIVKAYGEFDIA